MQIKWSALLCLCIIFSACEKPSKSVSKDDVLESQVHADSVIVEQTALQIEQQLPAENAFPKGKAFDYGPAKGTIMHVVGVRFDDVLNLRRAPAADAKLVTSKALGQLLFPQLLSLGSGWLPDNGGAWWQVEINHPGKSFHGEHVWAHTNYLKPLATAANKTDELVREIGSDYSGVEQLRSQLTELHSSDSHTVKSVISQDAMGIDATGGSVQIELLGYQDDSLYGEIFYVTFSNRWGVSTANNKIVIAQEIAQVIVTPICQRGVAEGLCL